MICMSLPPSVMVVDDEEELAILFKELLKGSGFNSVSFTDPLLALKRFKINPDLYSLVLTDLRMPKINGIQLAKRMRDVSSKVKILLVTAFYDEKDNQYDDEFKKAKISKVIEKPVHLAELRAEVSKLCESIY